MVATAIPSTTKDLHSAAGYTWIGASYLVAVRAASSIWVRISDIWGRKPAVLGAIMGSIVAGVSTTMPMLIAARGMQNLAGGGIMALVSIIISDLLQYATSSPVYQHNRACLGTRRGHQACHQRSSVIVCDLALVFLD